VEYSNLFKHIEDTIVTIYAEAMNEAQNKILTKCEHDMDPFLKGVLQGTIEASKCIQIHRIKSKVGIAATEILNTLIK